MNLVVKRVFGAAAFEPGGREFESLRAHTQFEIRSGSYSASSDCDFLEYHQCGTFAGPLEALADTEIPCAGFLDNESDHIQRRSELSPRIPSFQWSNDKDIEAALARNLSLDRLRALVGFASEINYGVAATNFLAQVRDHLRESWPDIEGTALDTLVEHCGEDDFRAALGQVMSQHGWFKSVGKGRITCTLSCR